MQPKTNEKRVVCSFKEILAQLKIKKQINLNWLSETFNEPDNNIEDNL